MKPDSVSIGGISAGGHITIVLQHLARDAKIPLRLGTFSLDHGLGCVMMRTQVFHT